MKVSELKKGVEARSNNSRLFFCRDTMRFFGDTLRNYGVRNGGSMIYHWDDTGNNWTEKGRRIELWELYRKQPVKAGQDSAYFDKATYRLVQKKALTI